MSGKVIPCALCQEEAAAVYCVNDDAHLCSGCDATVHAGNPLLARHERRPLSALACQAECASAAHTAISDHADVAVVPQLGAASTAPSAAAPTMMAAAVADFEPPTAALPPQPLALYEDSFFSRSLQASDLLDFEDDDLLLPGSSGASAFGGSSAGFDPLSDCVVPSFEAADLLPAGGDRYLEAASSSLRSQQSTFMHQQPAFVPAYLQHQQQPAAAVQQPSQLVPLGGGGMAVKPMAPPAYMHSSAAVLKQKPALDKDSEEARVQRHRERQRKKRNFGRAVRYQSRRAYAEIRPRIKGRFVTPEEYAAYQAQAAAAEKGCDAGFAADTYAPPSAVAPTSPSHHEEDAVVPMPAYGLA